MSREYLIAIVLCLAGITAAIALVPALDVFGISSPGEKRRWIWGWGIVTGCLVVAGVIIAMRTDGAVKEQGRMLPLIGMILFGCGFIACAAWYFWPTGVQRVATATGAPAASLEPPKGEEHATKGIAPPPPGLPSRKYAKGDAERVLSALWELYDTINSNVDAIGRVDGFWLPASQQMQGKSVKEKIEIATRIRSRVRAIANDVYQVIIPKYQYYADELRPLIEGDGVLGQANGAFNDFIAATDVLPADANERLVKSVLETKQAKLDQVMSDFVSWSRDSKTRISARRSEIEAQAQ